MKPSNEIPVAELHRLLELRPDGVLVRRERCGKFAAGTPVENRHSCGYVGLFIGKGRYFLAHRIVWAMTYGEWPKGQIDHINGDRRDNRVENLREADQAINSQNLRAAKPSVVGLLGVSKSRGGRFRARITVESKERRLGVFDTPDEAHAAYLAAKRVLHPGCTI